MAKPAKDLGRPTAIIVGGGPVGLMTALGLTRANIDFILLEQRKSVVVEEGSDMTLLPFAIHAVEQLNLLQPLSRLWSPAHQIERIDHRGREMGAIRIFKYLHQSTGHYPYVLSRKNLLQTFYQSLPKHAQDNILTGKKLSEIRETPDGVVVACTDGSEYHGAFVIGADGAYSAVRKCMRKLALAAGSSRVNEDNPFITTYQALWVRFPTAIIPSCKPGTAAETHGYGIATQLFAGEDTATVGVYRRLSEPTRKPSRYSEEEQAAFVTEWASLPLVRGGKFNLKDAYESRLGSGLLNLEEGILPQWSWNGRLVLVGDAAHKYTPSRGSGMNTGIVDAVNLTNELYDLSRQHCDSPQGWWHHSLLSGAFEAYQNGRLNDVTDGLQQASQATAMSTWANTGLRLFDQYVIPNSIFQWFIGRQLASQVKEAKPAIFKFE